MQPRKPFWFISIIVAVAFLAASEHEAQAAFIYTLRFNQSEYLVDPGGTAVVSLILREEVNGGDTNRITDTVGVTAGDVRVNWDAGGSKVNAVGDALFGAGFAGTSKVLTANDIVLLQISLAGVTGSQVSAFVREVGMGTLTFSVPQGLTSTIITFSDASGSDNLVIGSSPGFVVDPVVTYGSARITNPEPSTFLLTGMGILGIVAVRRFRRRRVVDVGWQGQSNAMPQRHWAN